MIRNTRESLLIQWPGIYELCKRETLETYQDTVRRGNKQTYSEFVEEMKEGWIEEMLKK